MSTSRCAANADPNQRILGETAKLVGNVGFGRFIMDVACHQEELSDEVFELKMYKKRIKCNLPNQIGFFIFTYTKIHMLELYYHSINAFLDRQDFQYLEMDSDSPFMSLAGDSLEELVKPDKKA